MVLCLLPWVLLAACGESKHRHVDDVEGVLHVTPTTDIVWVHQVLGMAQFTQAEVRGFPVHLLRANGGPDGLGNFFVNGVFHATIKGIDQVGDLVFKGRVLGPLLTGPNANTAYFTVGIDPPGTWPGFLSGADRRG